MKHFGAGIVSGLMCLRFVCHRIAVALIAIGVAGCRGKSDEPAPTVRGEPIPPASSSLISNSAPNVYPDLELLFGQPDVIEDGFIKVGFDRLSAFKYDVHEVYSETNAGRAMLRSEDVIPSQVKAYDGKRVVLTGFVLPLRTKRGLVTEFLLLRDQGTCCFGARAQINHFVRVKYSHGIRHEGPVPWVVSGTIRVGEIYIQGYLTGIYQLEAEKAEEASRGSSLSEGP